jgi:hypothetical protein
MKPISRQKENISTLSEPKKKCAEVSSQESDISSLTMDKKGQKYETSKAAFAGPPTIDGKHRRIVHPTFLLPALPSALPPLQSIIGTPTTRQDLRSFELKHLSPASAPLLPPLFMGNQQPQDRPPPQEISVLNHQRGASLRMTDLSSRTDVSMPHSEQRYLPSIRSFKAILCLGRQDSSRSLPPIRSGSHHIEKEYQGEAKQNLKTAPVDDEDGDAEWFSDSASLDSFDERISEVLHSTDEEMCLSHPSSTIS